MTNASFVAQTADWVPAHLYATLLAAYEHRGFAFVRVLQRCPQYTSDLFERAVRDPSLTELLVHERGITVPELHQIYQNQVPHDPADLHGARRLAQHDGRVRLGLFYRNEELPRYEQLRVRPKPGVEETLRRLNAELDRYAV